LGLVLARRGGALSPLLLAFRAGLGGTLAGGRQWWSWVHLDDLVAAVLAAITTPSLSGPVNVVAPGAVQNREFTRVLAAALRRPALLPVPALALRAVLGSMAETVMSSQRVEPAKLSAAGFRFRWPELGPALEDLLMPR
jgi:hypothetical protein